MSFLYKILDTWVIWLALGLVYLFSTVPYHAVIIVAFLACTVAIWGIVNFIFEFLHDRDGFPGIVFNLIKLAFGNQDRIRNPGPPARQHFWELQILE